MVQTPPRAGDTGHDRVANPRGRADRRVHPAQVGAVVASWRHKSGTEGNAGTAQPRPSRFTSSSSHSIKSKGPGHSLFIDDRCCPIATGLGRYVPDTCLRYTGFVLTAARLAEMVCDDLESGTGSGATLRLVRQFIMDLEHTSSAVELFDEEPPSTGDPRWDALIAGVVEDFALHHNLTSPKWVFDPVRYLDTWWFFTSIKDMRPWAMAHTPAALANRGVFIQRASLVNV